MKSITCSYDNITNSIRHMVKFPRKYDIIVGINRGGLPISVPLSNAWKLPHGVISLSTYDSEKQNLGLKFDTVLSVADTQYKIDDTGTRNVLLVDDIADSGKSLIVARLILKDLGYRENNIEIFTPYYKEKSIIRPNYYLYKIPDDVWCVFPWEKN